MSDAAREVVTIPVAGAIENLDLEQAVAIRDRLSTFIDEVNNAATATDHILDQVRALRAERAQLAETIQSIDGVIYALIRVALKAGYSTTVVAKELDMSRARVYQIRDGVNR